MIPALDVGTPKTIVGAVRSEAILGTANRPARLQPGGCPRCPPPRPAWTMVEWA